MQSPILSSTFGFVRVDSRFETRLGDVEAKRKLAPFLAIATDSSDLVAALETQTFRDWCVVPDAREDLLPFQRVLFRYGIVVTGERVFRELLKYRPTILSEISLTMMRYDIPFLWCTGLDGPACVVFSARHLIGEAVASTVPQGVVSSLSSHFYNHANSAYLSLHTRFASPKARQNPIRLWPVVGYLSSPIGSWIQNPTARKAFDSPPLFPLGRPLWATLSSDWYEHRRILLDYMGIGADIQVPGKLQHGWQSGTGIDGEHGFKLECRQNRQPVYLWNSNNLAAAGKEGLDWATAIGAPFLYMSDEPDPGPADLDSLLAMPYHSVPEYQIRDGWARYATELADFARSEGFRSVTVCLHSEDYYKYEIHDAMYEQGFVVTCLGQQFSSGYLLRCRRLIRAHSAVTSDRLCTAGFYALVSGRPFFVRGTPLEALTMFGDQDPDVGLGATPSWIADRFPELAKPTNVVHRETGLRELGADCMQSKDDLYRTLFWWL